MMEGSKRCCSRRAVSTWSGDQHAAAAIAATTAVYAMTQVWKPDHSNSIGDGKRWTVTGSGLRGQRKLGNGPVQCPAGVHVVSRPVVGEIVSSFQQRARKSIYNDAGGQHSEGVRREVNARRQTLICKVS